MTKNIVFISKDSNWQLYRNEVLTKLAFEHDYNIEILTTGTLKPHLLENERLKYRIFNNWFGKSKVSFFPGAIRYFLKSRPYAVLAVNNTTQLTEYVSLIICKLLGIKFVWWTHAYDHNPKRTGIVKSLKDAYSLFFLKMASAIITFSVAGKNYLAQHGAKAEKIFPALNTLDTEKLINLKERVKIGFSKSDFLSAHFKDYNDDDNPIVLLFSGRLKKDKKVANALNVVKLLKDMNTSARLLVVGDGDEKHNLVSLAEELGIQNRVYFAGSVFEERSISEFFLASDLFIMPGYVGLAIIHSFAFGLPIITENIGFHSPEIQFLINGKNGYLVEENGIEEMASIIVKIKNDLALFQQLKAGALDTVNNEANIYNMIKNMNRALTF